MADHADDAGVERPEVERAVAPARDPALPAQQLAEQDLEVELAPGEHGQVAVHRQHPVVGRQGGHQPGRHRLLADPREPLAELAPPQQGQHALLDGPGQEQRPVEGDQLAVVEVVGEPGGGPGTGGGVHAASVALRGWVGLPNGSTRYPL
jgi:hypothetical protein